MVIFPSKHDVSTYPSSTQSVDTGLGQIPVVSCSLYPSLQLLNLYLSLQPKLHDALAQSDDVYL